MAEDIKKLIQQSKDQTFFIGVRRRRAAVKKLGEIGTPQVVVPLVEALRDEDNEVKRYAFQGLSNLKDPVAWEVLRNLYLKTKNKALWQIIKKNNMYPEGLAERFEFLAKVGDKDGILKMVNKDNFMEILDMVIESEIEDPAKILLIMVEKVGDEHRLDIIKKFVETKNDALFEVIDKMGWYPPSLDKKIMFLLKTERYDKVNQMLDGANFRDVLDILVNPKFPMKKQAGECLSQAKNPIIIDEICRVYLEERNPHLGKMIFQNAWAPNEPRERIFFYLRTEFLMGFFKARGIEPNVLGGYLEIPEIKRKMTQEEYLPVANFLQEVAQSISKKEPPKVKDDNPLDELHLKAKAYLEKPKSEKVIKEICEEFLNTRSPFLEHLIKKEGWAPEDLEEKVVFYLLSKQEKQIKRLNEKAIRPLFKLMKGEGKNKDPEVQKLARDMLSTFKNPKAIDEIFRIYFEDMDPDLEKIIHEKNWSPTNKQEKALFFIFSGQPERYTEIEPKGFSVIMKAYKNLDVAQRFRLLEILRKSKAENFVDFMLDLFEYEKNPRVLKLLCTIIPVFFTKVYKSLRERLPRLEGTALREIIKTLAELNTAGSLSMLYYIAKIKHGYIALWILKLLEDARYQPENTYERKFFYELYKIRDEMFRILQNRLVDEDPQIRAHSAYVFAKLGDERIVPTLMKYVDDPVDEVKAAMAYSIGYICAMSPEKALEQISSFRVSAIYMIFNDVRKAFMVSSDLEQIQILTRNYDVGNFVLRSFAIAALEGLQKREGIPTLIKAINDSSPLVRKTALKALISLSDTKARDALFKVLEDDDKEVRLLAAEALGNIANDEICERIERIINKGEFSHSDGYITVLGFYDAKKYRKLFERVIYRPDFDLDGKAAAVISIGRIGDKEATKYIIKQFKNVQMTSDRKEDLIPYIKAMGLIGSVSVYKPLEELYRIGDWDIRKLIVESMRYIPHRIALVFIIKALQDKNGWVQMTALDSLAYFMNNHFKFEYTEKDLKFLGTIINRLRKFNLHEIIDRYAPEYKILVKLRVMLMENDLTRKYVGYKRKIVPSQKG